MLSQQQDLVIFILNPKLKSNCELNSYNCFYDNFDDSNNVFNIFSGYSLYVSYVFMFHWKNHQITLWKEETLSLTLR